MAEAFEAARVSMPAVIARSLNCAAELTAVAASRELAKQTGLKARAARENVEVTKHASHISATGPHHWFERTGRERLPIRRSRSKPTCRSGSSGPISCGWPSTRRERYSRRGCDTKWSACWRLGRSTGPTPESGSESVAGMPTFPARWGAARRSPNSAVEEGGR